jgi:signal transduction histidine kinase
MCGAPGAVYCGDVTSQAAAAGQAAISALWAPRSWRATLHALTGLAVVAVTFFLLSLWLLDIVTLADGPGDDAVLNAFYVIVAVAGPVPLLWWLGTLSAVQRVRFRTVLGIDIPAPPRMPGPWPQRLARAGRSPAAWRHLGYHLLSVPIGLVGGLAVAACWSAPVVAATYPGGLPVGPAAAPVLAAILFLAAPWVARAVVAVDERAALALLGPSPAQQLELRVQALARSRAEVVAAADAERRRIERDLHDGAQQQLVSLAMNLGMARAQTATVAEAHEAIAEAHEEAKAALAELRNLIRGLHPPVLEDRGLDAALSGVAARMPIPVRLTVDLPRRPSPVIEAVAYFVVSEALANIAKHAQASQAEVFVHRANDRLHVIVSDDGVGGADPALGTGLTGLAKRASSVDGTFEIASPPGGPTLLTADLPCAR